MSRFSKVIAGTRARVEGTLPLPGASIDPDTGKWEGRTERIHLRALNDNEHSDVLRDALAFAKSNGVENPEDGDPLYEQGKWIHTIARACIDPESPEDNPQRYFDGGADQIHQSEILTPEIIAYVFEQQRVHQDDVNPLTKTFTTEDYEKAIKQVAGGNLGFFVSMRRGLQWTFTRTLASQLLASRASSSSPTPPSEKPQDEPTSASEAQE